MKISVLITLFVVYNLQVLLNEKDSTIHGFFILQFSNGTKWYYSTARKCNQIF
jgi:hypothetical protein